MGLGMHPASLYPRRSRIAPKRKAARTYKKLANCTFIVRPRPRGVKWFSQLELLGFRCLTQVYSRPHNFKYPPLTFDEQLQRALDAFTGRLREEVTRQVRVVGDELVAAARAEQVPAERGPATGRIAEGIRAMSGARSLSEVLDTLVSCAGQEAVRTGVLLVRGHRYQGWRFLGFDPSFDNASSVDALPSGQGSVTVPIVIGGQVVAVLYADAGLEPGTLDPEPLEILARFASQRLEALTAIKAARSLTAIPDPPAPAPGRPGRNDDSADEHAAARRYARLLVSEIKLYHEPQVAEGRRERDLATRLGGEIARVRTLYEQRVPAEVRQSTDYVHEELIRTLADGDASLLEAKT